MLADNVCAQPATNKGLLARHPLVFSFIIAYSGSWLVVLPYLRFGGGAGLLPFNWPVPFAVSAAVAPFAGPFLAAFIMTGVSEGRAGIRRLLRRIVQWRVGLRWYLFALVGIPAITVLGASVLPGVLGSFQTSALSLLLTYPISFVVSLLIGGPLGEEPGWRGFALPRLQRLSRSPRWEPLFGDPLGLLAPAVFLDAGMGYTQEQHRRHRLVCVGCHRPDRHLYVGLQQYEGQPAHRHPGARVPTTRFS